MNELQGLMPLSQYAVAVALHQIATIVWVGGMFFAHMALRPAVNQLLDPPKRLPLMGVVLGRFFPWVWAAVLLLWLSGLWIFLGLYGGKMGVHVHAMMGLATVMTLLFGFIFFGPFRAMRRALELEDWPAAALGLGRIRVIIVVNMLLGMTTAVIGAAGRFLFVG